MAWHHRRRRVLQDSGRRLGLAAADRRHPILVRVPLRDRARVRARRPILRQFDGVRPRARGCTEVSDLHRRRATATMPDSLSCKVLCARVAKAVAVATSNLTNGRGSVASALQPKSPRGARRDSVVHVIPCSRIVVIRTSPAKKKVL